jgi:PAS domain S-box-containing protein
LNTPSSTSLAYSELGAIISRVQSRFIRAAPPDEIFQPLLTDLLEVTGSEYGFIADVLTDPADGHRFLRIRVLTDISWSDATRVMFERHHSGEQALEFHSPSTLFGAALTTGQPVIANDPWNDPRRGGLPHGHPDLQSFLAVPLFHGGEMVGMVGMANRAGGYDEAMVEFLQPLFASVAAIIDAVRMDKARRQAEQALRESEERLRTTFEMAAVGIAHIAPDGRFLRANRRLCDILGRTSDDLLRMRVHDVTLPEDADTDRRHSQRLLDGQAQSYTLEKRYVRADEVVVWVSVTAALVRGSAGEPAHFVSVVEDITERRRTQAALLTAQAAERANAAKTEFLSRMSHELRTPLNAVLGFAQLLLLDSVHPPTPDQQAKLKHIENAGAHLLAMINDVLDLSRIESGSMPLASETVALSTLIDEALVLVATAARDAGIRLKVEPPEAGATYGHHACADHLRLRQVVVNLLSNAIKYNRPQGVVSVSWGVAPEGDAVQVQVSDTGRGLTEAQRSHLFEPFNRLGAEHSSVEGTGIGLVVTQRLVQLMAGTISVHSTPGVGSCFTVRLPFAHADGSAPIRPHPKAQAAQSAVAARPLRTVLYAEDNPMNVELVREVMRLREDCRLVVARSGQEAIDLAKREQPDLLLLDMHLGDMSGFDVVDCLREDATLAHVPCVALSADAMPAPMAAAKNAGFEAYLTKPLDLGTFLRCIDDALQPALRAGSAVESG